MRYKRGQSTIEYILLITAIIGALLFVLSPVGGPLRTSIQGLFTRSGTKVDTATDMLAAPPAP